MLNNAKYLRALDLKHHPQLTKVCLSLRLVFMTSLIVRKSAPHLGDQHGTNTTWLFEIFHSFGRTSLPPPRIEMALSITRKREEEEHQPNLHNFLFLELRIREFSQLTLSRRSNSPWKWLVQNGSASTIMDSVETCQENYRFLAYKPHSLTEETSIHQQPTPYPLAILNIDTGKNGGGLKYNERGLENSRLAGTKTSLFRECLN